MIKHFKAFNKEFDFKGLKKEIEFFERILGRLTSIKSYKMDITGITGLKDGSINAEHESVFYVMFGQHQLRDEDKFNEKVDELLSKYNNSIIIPEDLVKLKSAVDNIFNEHVCVEDKRKTPEQHKTEVEARNRINAENEAKMKEDNRLKEIAKEKIKKEYPQLLLSNKDISSRLLATKNIRIELGMKYPGHKFSITSDTFSGGDSIDVRWEDGATEKEVNEIIRKYQEGYFDGMNDIYNYSYDPFNDLFGGAKFVHANRKINNERWIEVGKELGYTVTFEDYKMFVVDEKGETGGYDRVISDALRERSFYVKPETTYPEPEEKLQISSESGITILENREKDGIEIRFPDKPTAEVLTKLKANGFRWNHRTKVWYKKRSQNALIFANSLKYVGTDDGLTTESEKEAMSYDNYKDMEMDEFTKGLERNLQEESRNEIR